MNGPRKFASLELRAQSQNDIIFSKDPGNPEVLFYWLKGRGERQSPRLNSERSRAAWTKNMSFSPSFTVTIIFSKEERLSGAASVSFACAGNLKRKVNDS